MPSTPSAIRGKRSRIGPIAALALALLVFYVLSIGPAQWAVRRDLMSINTYHRVYRPVLWALAHSASLDRAALWYVRLWTDLPAPHEPPK